MWTGGIDRVEVACRYAIKKNDSVQCKLCCKMYSFSWRIAQFLFDPTNYTYCELYGSDCIVSSKSAMKDDSYSFSKCTPAGLSIHLFI